jgi:transcriptional regulator with XRE-family HTH domain
VETTNPITKRIATNVVQLRKLLKMSRREFADKIGRSAQNIMYWETERSEVSQACMALMASTFNLDPFWFFESHDNSEAVAKAYHLPPPPPGAPSELVDWVKAAIRASRDPVTDCEHVDPSNPLPNPVPPRLGLSLYGSMAPPQDTCYSVFPVPF